LEDQCVITREITVAAGVFAPGHLGELTQIVPFEMVDAALAATGTTQARIRVLPARVVVYLLLAGCLFAELGYRQVWHKLTAGLGRLPVASPGDNALWQARARLGAAPLRWLFDLLRGPATAITAGSVRWHGLLVCAIDGTTMTIPDSPRNLAAYGKQAGNHGGSGYPLLRLVALAACGTRTLIDAVFGPASCGEQDYTRRLRRSLHAGMIVLLDRNFDVAALLGQLAATKADLLRPPTSSPAPSSTWPAPSAAACWTTCCPTGGCASAPASSNARSPNTRPEVPTSTGAATKPPSTSTSSLQPDLDTRRPDVNYVALALVDGRSRSCKVPGGHLRAETKCDLRLALPQVKSKIAWLDRVVRDRIELSRDLPLFRRAYVPVPRLQPEEV
jgi:Insertion element 4 transposase N-terminal/Transposase DDE domain